MNANETKGDIVAALATVLDEFMFSTRLTNTLDRLRLRSVADLVKLTPKELRLGRNVGAKTVAEARAAIQTVVGVSWEEAREHLLGVPQTTTDEPRDVPSEPRPLAERWEHLRVRLAPYAHTRLRELDLPTRSKTFAAASGIQTLGGLLAVPWDELSSAKHLGQRTLNKMLSFLDSFLAKLTSAESEPFLSDVASAPPFRVPVRSRKVLRVRCLDSRAKVASLSPRARG